RIALHGQSDVEEQTSFANTLNEHDVILKGAPRPEGSLEVSTNYSVETSGDPSATFVPHSAQDDDEKLRDHHHDHVHSHEHHHSEKHHNHEHSHHHHGASMADIR